MIKFKNSDELKRERIKNMKKWTAEDYLFYQSFFDEIMKLDVSSPSKENEEQEIDESFRQLQKRIAELKQGLDKKP